MAPPSRPYWKGYLRLALVQIAVQIHNATEASKTSLNQIHKSSGKRINYTITVGGEESDRNDVVKAYPVAEDTYITLEPEELDAIKLERKRSTCANSSGSRMPMPVISSGPITSCRKMNLPKKAIGSFTPR
jgi:DNA end-binding protein Ku